MNSVVLRACLKTAARDIALARENPFKGQALARAHTLLNAVLQIVESEEPHSSQRPKRRIQVPVGKPMNLDLPLRDLVEQSIQQTNTMRPMMVVNGHEYHLIDVELSQSQPAMIYAVYEEC